MKSKQMQEEQSPKTRKISINSRPGQRTKTAQQIGEEKSPEEKSEITPEKNISEKSSSVPSDPKHNPSGLQQKPLEETPPASSATSSEPVVLASSRASGRNDRKNKDTKKGKKETKMEKKEKKKEKKTETMKESKNNNRKSNDDEEEDEIMCRFCFNAGDTADLISPCNCKGGQKYVHLKCLRMWQRMVLVSQPTHPGYYEDDVRHHKCNVCTSEFTCPPPKRVELMESFTGAEIAALVRDGCIISSSPGFSAEIESRLQRALPIERPFYADIEHWLKGVFLISSVDSEPEVIRLPVESASRLRAFQAEFNDGTITHGDRTLELVAEESLSGCNSWEEILETFQKLEAPSTLVFKFREQHNYGDDKIEAVNIVRKMTTLTEGMESEVEDTLSKVKKKLGEEKYVKPKIKHFIGGPCDTDSIACCVVFRDSGRGWAVFRTLQEAIEAYKPPHNTTGISPGQPVELVGLKKAKSLNGQLGLTLNYLERDARWVVRVGDGNIRKVKEKNLMSFENENGDVMCFWGSAMWTRTQLLGELARGSWGLCCASVVDMLTPVAGKWDELQSRLVFPPITDMSDDYMRRAQEEMQQVQLVAPELEQGQDPEP